MTKDQLARANGSLRTGTALAMIIGPFAAGLIVVAIGPGWTLGIDGLSYAVSAVCLALVALPPDAQSSTISRKRHVGRDLREGFRAYAERRWLWLLVGQFGLLNLIAIAPFRVIAPVLLSTRPDGARACGALLAAIGAGGGAFGIGAAVLSVLTLTAIQREIPLDVLSRVMSVVQLADMGLTPLGYVLAAPAAALLGPHVALASAATCVLISVGVLLSSSDIRLFGAPSTQSSPMPATS